MEKFCLKWNEFEGNIKESFKKLRVDQVLADVTLVTEDGQQIQACKIIYQLGVISSVIFLLRVIIQICWYI